MKRYRVIVSQQAAHSLKEICDYIDGESSTAAKYVRRSLIQLIKSLNQSPEKYSSEPILADRKGNYRSVVKWHYKIVYSVTGRNVIVLDIIHTSRNPKNIRKIK